MVYDEHRFDTSTAPNDGLQDGAKSAAQYHTLSKPRALVLSSVEGLDRG